MGKKPISVQELNSSLFPNLKQLSYHRAKENKRRSPASNVAVNDRFVYVQSESVLKAIKVFNDTSFQLPSDKVSWVSRREWGARPAKWMTNLHPRINYVFFTSTRSAPCTTKDMCIDKVAHKQEVQMDNKLTGKNDIIYNFLIGGDGNIYEGRGWTYRPELPRNFRTLSNKSILIAFIGRYHYHAPDEKMFKAANEIIRLGLYMDFLEKKLVEFILPP